MKNYVKRKEKKWSGQAVWAIGVSKGKGGKPQSRFHALFMMERGCLKRMESYKLTYNVDMVFCIDATGSMRHVLDFVKQNALNLYRDVVAEMEKKHKVINQLRVRVIAFRDYVADGEDAMLSSDFFELPEQAQMFYDCVNGISAKGGGDRLIHKENLPCPGCHDGFYHGVSFNAGNGCRNADRYARLDDARTAYLIDKPHD